MRGFDAGQPTGFINRSQKRQLGPQSQQIDCDTRATPLGSAESAPTSDWVTRDPALGSYHYNWQTSKAWAATCRRFTVGLDDGTRHSADFSFR